MADMVQSSTAPAEAPIGHRGISDRWFKGSSGNHFFDWGGFRYAVVYHPMQVGGYYTVARNGEPFGTDWKRFSSRAAAQRFVEFQSGYRGRKVSA